MTLYEHETGEKVRTVTGGPEDERLQAEGSGWNPVDESAEEPAQAKPQPARSSRSTSSSSSTDTDGS